MQFITISEIETFFANIQHKKKDFPPFFMLNKALNVLGNPQNDFEYIQITGTNGKGSTSNYLSQFLTGHKLNIGLFTSPHIFNITERIKYNNQEIDETDFIRIFNNLHEKFADEYSLIQFEWLFLLSLVYYQEKEIDFIILEVGIGGLFDTTNIIPHKLAAVITNVDFDHQKILGNTIESITKQKAGIITPHTKYAFIGNVNPISVNIIKKQVAAANSEAYYFEKDYYYDRLKNEFIIDDYHIKNSNASLPLYQQQNITLALAIAIKVLSKINKTLNIELIQNIINNFILSIRFEIIKKDTNTFIFDGAHNMSGIKTMLTTLKEKFPSQRYTFIFCAMADKEYKKMLDQLMDNGDVMLYDYHQIYHRAFTIDTNNTLPVLYNEKELLSYVENEHDKIFVYVGSIYYVSYIRKLF